MCLYWCSGCWAWWFHADAIGGALQWTVIILSILPWGIYACVDSFFSFVLGLIRSDFYTFSNMLLCLSFVFIGLQFSITPKFTIYGVFPCVFGGWFLLPAKMSSVQLQVYMSLTVGKFFIVKGPPVPACALTFSILCLWASSLHPVFTTQGLLL